MVQARPREPRFHVLPVGLGLEFIERGPGAGGSADIDMDPHGTGGIVRVEGPAGHAEGARAAGSGIQAGFYGFPAAAVVGSAVAQQHLIAPVGIIIPQDRPFADAGGGASLVSAYKGHPPGTFVIIGDDAHMPGSAVAAAEEQEVSGFRGGGKGLVAAAVLHLPLHQIVGVGAVLAVGLVQAHAGLGGAPAGKHGAPVVPGIIPAPTGDLGPPGAVNRAVGIRIAQLGSGHIRRVDGLVPGHRRQRKGRLIERTISVIPVHRCQGPQAQVDGLFRLAPGKEGDPLRRFIALMPGAEQVFALLQQPAAVRLRQDHGIVTVPVQPGGVLEQKAGVLRVADKAQAAESLLFLLCLLHRGDLTGILPVPNRRDAPFLFRQGPHRQQSQEQQACQSHGQDPFWQQFHRAHLACSLQYRL